MIKGVPHKKLLCGKLLGNVAMLSMHEHGCRVVQKALESINDIQKIKLATELEGCVLACVEDQNGNHVIQKCLERMPTGKVQFIIDAFKGEVRRMATHCYGSRVLQRIIEYCDPNQVADVYDEIHGNNLSVFIHDQFGNYVIQNMVEYGRPIDRQKVFDLVQQFLATMSCHKYASNIVEKSLQQANDEEKVMFINMVLGETPPPGCDYVDPNNPPLLTMMKDKFGNYVVQKLMQIAEGDQKLLLEQKLNEFLPVLEKLPYGKHILFALKETDDQAENADEDLLEREEEEGEIESEDEE